MFGSSNERFFLPCFWDFQKNTLKIYELDLFTDPFSQILPPFEMFFPPDHFESGGELEIPHTDWPLWWVCND